jgi:hypothetical protein
MDNTINRLVGLNSSQWTNGQIPNFNLHLYNKRVRPTKNEPRQQGITYLEREREGVRERGGKRERGNRAGQQVGIFKVRLGLVEIQR